MLRIILLPLRIAAIIVTWILQFLCWLLTGHHFAIADQHRIKYGFAHEGIRAGELWTLERCSTCGAERLTIGGFDDPDYTAISDRSQSLANTRRRA